MFRITKTYNFSAAHRIIGHPKCGRLHGHNYQVDVTLGTGYPLDKHGFVMDFGIMNEIMKPFLASVDHYYMAADREQVDYVDVVRLDVETTSAENLARWFYYQLEDQMLPHILSVTVWETPKARATYYAYTKT